MVQVSGYYFEEEKEKDKNNPITYINRTILVNGKDSGSTEKNYFLSLQVWK